MPLEPRAARVLRFLVEHNDRVTSKEELLEDVWPDVFTTDGVLKKAVSQIRRALNDDPDRPRFIATYHGRGYRFIAPVTRSNGGKTTPQSSLELVPNYDVLAGRESEMTTLRAALRSTLEGKPCPIVLTGEPGIGKTQLARHFRRAAVEQEAISLFGRFFDYRGARLAPYEVFIDLLRSAVTTDPDAPLGEAIEAACGVRLPPALFASSDPVGANASSVGDHYRFVIPICRAFLALSKVQPMVVVLDDVQWADSASLDLIGCLMQSLDSEPLMLMLLVRSDDADDPEHPIRRWLQDYASRRRYTTLRLDRLTLSACRQMIGQIFRARRNGEIPRSDIERLHQLTDGNPYFLVETLRILISANAIVSDPAKGCWVWKGIRDLALPQTIVTAARAKIEALPKEVRTVVEHAAVIGDEFRVEALCGVSRIEEERAESVLSDAVRSGVLTIRGLSPGEDCRFQHSILRQVIYDSIPPFRRRQLHARAADALETVYAGERDRISEALSAHYWAAGDAPRAFEAGMHAWRTAARRSEWSKATRLIERVEEAAGALEETGRLTERQRVELWIAAGDTYRSVGRIREAAEAIDRAVRLAQSAGDQRALARAFIIRGLTDIALSSYSEARISLTQALDLFLTLDDSDAAAQTTVQLAAVSAATGNAEHAVSLIEPVLARNPAPDIVEQANAILGWSLALRGRSKDAQVLLERSLDYHSRAGNLCERAMILRRLHQVHLAGGDYETAISLAVRARTDSDTIGDTNGVAKANLAIAQARVAQGLYAEGISFLTRIIDHLQSTGDRHCEAECLWQLGRAHGESGNLVEARNFLEFALAKIRSVGDRHDELRILIDRARVCLSLGDLGEAAQDAEKAAAIARSLDDVEGAALAQLELARVELAKKNVRAAQEKASAANDVLDQRRSSERWRGWAVVGMVERAAGQADSARASLARAVGFLDEIRDQIDSADSARRHEIGRARDRVLQDGLQQPART